jgi:hypothetical protein
MADISLTDYSIFLNHFAESRKLFLLKKTTRCIALVMHWRCCLPVSSGQAIGMGVSAFRVCGTQKTGYFSGTKPVHAPVPHWAGNPLPGAGWRFGHPFKQRRQTQIKVCARGEKCHAIPILSIH